MIRIDTRWIVANMTDVHAIGDRAVIKLVGNAMSLNHAVVESEAAIPKTIPVSCPFPTRVGVASRNLRPESFDDRGGGHDKGCASKRSVFVGGIRQESQAALFVASVSSSFVVRFTLFLLAQAAIGANTILSVVRQVELTDGFGLIAMRTGFVRHLERS